jgi:DNA end-binding protein Ku
LVVPRQTIVSRGNAVGIATVMARRPIWTGTISFGLVTIPVRMHTAISQKDVRFHMIDKKSGARIRNKRVSAKTGREVSTEQIAKGYELGRDRYVVIDPEELETLDAKATHTIDIEDFVDLEEIDPIYFENTYYLAPGRGGDKAYALLHKAMEDQERIGIGRVVIRTKQYLAAIRPMGKALVMHTMLFGDEVVPVSDIEGIPERMPRVSDQEKQMAKRLIESMTVAFDPDRYKDEYRERVEDLIAKKAEGETVEITETEDEESPKVASLIEALKASVERGGESKPHKRETSHRRKKSA